MSLKTLVLLASAATASAVSLSNGRSLLADDSGSLCAVEGGTCHCNGIVSYQAWWGGNKAEQQVQGSIHCGNSVFGDVAPWHFKSCYCRNECPAVSPVSDLDFAEYIRASWYIQQQQVTGYQPKDSLYCVVATYGLEEKSVPFFNGNVVSVQNYANVGGVNGPNQNEASTPLCARQENPSDAARLLVAPCFLPNFFAGDYWVVAYGANSAGQYEWAVVSGGQPTQQYADGCTTTEEGINGSGLWIFSRAPVASQATLNAARSAAQSLGFSLSRLQNVAQEGCAYSGAQLK